MLPTLLAVSPSLSFHWLHSSPSYSQTQEVGSGLQLLSPQCCLWGWPAARSCTVLFLCLIWVSPSLLAAHFLPGKGPVATSPGPLFLLASSGGSSPLVPRPCSCTPHGFTQKTSAGLSAAATPCTAPPHPSSPGRARALLSPTHGLIARTRTLKPALSPVELWHRHPRVQKAYLYARIFSSSRLFFSSLLKPRLSRAVF